jgi:large repetitive protein
MPSPRRSASVAVGLVVLFCIVVVGISWLTRDAREISGLSDVGHLERHSSHPDSYRSKTSARSPAELPISTNSPGDTKRPAWTAPYGREFWRGTRDQAFNSHPKTLTGTSNINVADVISRVSNRIAPGTHGTSAFVNKTTYSAIFHRNGFTFLPRDQSVRNVDVDSPPDLTRFSMKATIATRGIRRGGQSLYEKSGDEWYVLGNTAQRLLDAQAGIIEHCEISDVGIHLTWQISSPPPAAGALSVALSLSGIDYIGSSETGHHFGDGDVARLCVGNALLVDSSGRTWKLQTERQGDLLVTEVPEAVLTDAAYPIAVDPLIGPEFGIDNPVIVPAESDQSQGKLTTDGTNYFVVWGDARTLPRHIYGVRVTKQGELLDPLGIMIATNAFSPVVSSMSNQYLVVFSVHVGPWELNDYDLVAVRVTHAGIVLDATPLPLSRAPGAQIASAIANNGRNYCLVWQDHSNIYNPAHLMTLINPQGVPRNTNGVPFGPSGPIQWTEAIASNGREFLIAWTRYTTNFPVVVARRVTESGELAGDLVQLTDNSNHSGVRSVASDGDGYAIAWNRSVVRLGRDGTVLDQMPITSPGFVDVLPGPTGYWLMWFDWPAGIYTAYLNRDGSTSGTRRVPLAFPYGGFAKAVGNPEEFFYLWDAHGGFSSLDLFGTLVVAGVPTPAEGLLLTRGAQQQWYPVAAAGRTNVCIVWEDFRTQQSYFPDVYGARVGFDGAILDPNGIAFGTTTNAETRPCVSAAKDDYLVLWHVDRNWPEADLLSQRVPQCVSDPIGEKLSITSSAGKAGSSVSSDGTNYLVMWSDTRFFRTNENYDVYGEIFPPSPTVRRQIPVCTASNMQYGPVVAAGPSGYLALWVDRRSGTNYDLYATPISWDGTVASPNGSRLPVNNFWSMPKIASNGTSFFAAWHAAGDGNIYGLGMSPHGAPLQPAPMAIVRSGVYAILTDVIGLNSDYLVFWQQNTNFNAGHFCARVNANGQMIETNLLAIFDGNVGTAVYTEQGRVLLLNQGFWQGGHRITGRFGTFNVRPRAHASSLLSREDTPTAIQLTSSDENNDRLSYTIVSLPANGTLSGLAPNLVYVPRPDFFGIDSLRFSVSDGQFESSSAEVRIIVEPVNDPPRAFSQLISLNEDNQIEIRLSAEDVDGDPLTYIVQGPTHGAISGIPPLLSYRPARDYFGQDSLTFRVSDGSLESPEATIRIDVVPVNDPPIAIADLLSDAIYSALGRQFVVVAANNSNVLVRLSAAASRDVDGDPLQFSWYEGASEVPFAFGVEVTNLLSPGLHDFRLRVNDGRENAEDAFEVLVVVPAQIVRDILLQIDTAALPRKAKRPCITTLKHAVDAFEMGRFDLAVNLLEAFRQKVEAQIEPLDLTLATALVDQTYRLLEILSLHSP